MAEHRSAAILYQQLVELCRLARHVPIVGNIDLATVKRFPFVGLAFFVEAEGSRNPRVALMKLPSHLHCHLELSVVVRIEVRAIAYETRYLPAALWIGEHERVVKAKELGGLKRL